MKQKNNNSNGVRINNEAWQEFVTNVEICVESPLIFGCSR